MDPAILIKKAVKGNKEAFYELISLYKEQLYKTAYAYLKNETDALEAIQEVTYRAYKNIKKLKQAHFFLTWFGEWSHCTTLAVAFYIICKQKSSTYSFCNFLNK